MITTVERRWEAHGLDCVVTRNEWGRPVMLGLAPYWRCGYARVPEDHPWHGKNYDDDTGFPADIAERELDDTDLLGVLAAAFGGDLSSWSSTISGHVSVHGGITFSGTMNERDWAKGWYFGFDCNHAFDEPGDWPTEAVAAETERLAGQLAAVALLRKEINGPA